MKNPIVLENHPEIGNLTRASLYLLFTMPLFPIVIGAVVFINAYNLMNDDVAPGEMHPAFGLLLFIPLLVALYFLIKNSTRRRLWRTPKNFEVQKMTFDHEGVSIDAESYNVRYSWPSIIKIKETGSWFLIYTNKLAAMPLEKKTMTAKQCDELRTFFVGLPVKKKLKS